MAICQSCEENNATVKFRGEDYGNLCDECYEEEFTSVHLDDDEDEKARDEKEEDFSSENDYPDYYR